MIVGEGILFVLSVAYVYTEGGLLMKKLLVANVLLLFSLIYVIVRVTHSTLYLPKLSIEADNPVSLHWNAIAINTGIIKNSSESMYLIWMTPVNLLVLIALVLTFLAFKEKR